MKDGGGYLHKGRCLGLALIKCKGVTEDDPIWQQREPVEKKEQEEVT